MSDDIDNDGTEPEYNDDPLEEWQIERMLEQIAGIDATLAGIDDQHAKMVAAYDEWRDDQSVPYRSHRADLVNRIQAWAMYRVEANPDGPKSFRLPSGTVTTRAGTQKVEIVDPGAFMMWALSNRVDVLRWPEPPEPQPNLPVIKTALRDGEVIPGAVLAEGKRTVDVRPIKTGIVES